MGIKYDEGDEVRLTRNKEFGSVQIRKNTVGTVKKVKKKFGANDIVVRFRGLSFDITIVGGKDIAPNGDQAW
jgi:hypothetical protein